MALLKLDNHIIVVVINP